MKRSENTGDNFEQQWRSALLEGEVTPPASVWGEVDRSLANQEVTQLKKKALIYKWAAVVALLLAFSLALTNILDIQLIRFAENSANDQLAADQTSTPIEINRPRQESTASIELTNTETDESVSTVDTKQYSPGAKQTAIFAMASDASSEDTQVAEADLLTLDLSQLRVIGLFDDQERSRDIISRKMPRKMYIFEKYRFKEKEIIEKEQFWASVGMGSGTFNPNYQQNTNNSVAAAMLNADRSSFVNVAGGRTAVPEIQENIEEGMNYQVGVNLGMEVFDRFVLETGLQYAVAQTTTNTNITIENRFFTESVALTSEAATINAVAAIADQQEIIEYKEGDVALNNTFQFASIPVKAGYVLIDRKFNLRINAGMLTNFYLGNTLREENETVAALEISPGDNSPYRDISFTGVTGLTLGYRLKERFNLTLEPNYQQAITPLTKGSSNFDFAPSGLGIMAGVRYKLF
jgi:hypothetical protein